MRLLAGQGGIIDALLCNSGFLHPRHSTVPCIMQNTSVFGDFSHGLGRKTRYHKAERTVCMDCRTIVTKKICLALARKWDSASDTEIVLAKSALGVRDWQMILQRNCTLRAMFLRQAACHSPLLSWWCGKKFTEKFFRTPPPPLRGYTPEKKVPHLLRKIFSQAESHLEERLLDQAQVCALYTPLFWRSFA